MKKHLLSLLVIILIAVAACTKSTTNANALTYSVNGLTDVTVTQYNDTTFIVAVALAYESGKQEAVTLTPTGLPAGVTVTPASFSGTPGFATTFTFHADVTTSGSFPITINAASASSGTKTFSFNLIVSPGLLFGYTVTGLSDITIPQYVDTTITLPVSVGYVQGTAETVTLTPAAPPAGVTVVPTPASGVPGFSSDIALHSAINTPGTYPVTINSSSASTSTQAHTFNIIVTASSNCAPEITGTYTGNTVCASWTGMGTGTQANETIVSGGASNKVVINLPFANVTADLTCSAGTLVTEPRTNADFTIPAGSGTFNANTVVVNYTLTGSINSTCTTTFTR